VFILSILAALLYWLQSLKHPVYVMIGDDIHYVYANGVPLCSTRTLPKAVMLFMAIYYVFNMVVCKHAMRTVIFVLKFGCNIDNDVCDVYV